LKHNTGTGKILKAIFPVLFLIRNHEPYKGKTPIGQIVTEEYRSSQIYKNRKIDLFCQGNRSIHEAAEKRNGVITKV
jgi:hypothetical protein